MDQTNPVVNVAFQVRGAAIPADHGYLLYAAISKHLPWLHGEETAGIDPIRGQLVGGRQLALTRLSRPALRLSACKIPDAIWLTGQHPDFEVGR